MSIISVTPSARCQGQTIINTYWYRSAVALPFAELFGWAEAIAAAWADLFWTGDVGTRMQDLLPDDYVLETILVDFRDDDGVLLNTIPYSVAVDLAGGNTGSFDGNHNCAIMHFSLGGAPGPGLDLPRRGYVALGPIVSDAIGDNGVLTGATLDTLQELGTKMATNLVTELPPSLLFPVRVRVNRPPLLPEYYRWRDAEACAPRTRIRVRRSRLTPQVG